MSVARELKKWRLKMKKCDSHAWFTMLDESERNGLDALQAKYKDVVENANWGNGKTRIKVDRWAHRRLPTAHEKEKAS